MGALVGRIKLTFKIFIIPLQESILFFEIFDLFVSSAQDQLSPSAYLFITCLLCPGRIEPTWRFRSMIEHSSKPR